MVSKIGDPGDLPTVEITRCNGQLIYTEEIIDWRRVDVDPDTGEKIVLEEPRT